jgi:hypothetical protein
VKPVSASVTVPHPREEVYDFLDMFGNHESFTDHVLIDWKLSGPRAQASARKRECESGSPGQRIGST